MRRVEATHSELVLKLRAQQTAKAINGDLQTALAKGAFQKDFVKSLPTDTSCYIYETQPGYHDKEHHLVNLMESALPGITAYGKTLGYSEDNMPKGLAEEFEKIEPVFDPAYIAPQMPAPPPLLQYYPAGVPLNHVNIAMMQRPDGVMMAPVGAMMPPSMQPRIVMMPQPIQMPIMSQPIPPFTGIMSQPIQQPRATMIPQPFPPPVAMMSRPMQQAISQSIQPVQPAMPMMPRIAQPQLPHYPQLHYPPQHVLAPVQPPLLAPERAIKCAYCSKKGSNDDASNFIKLNCGHSLHDVCALRYINEEILNKGRTLIDTVCIECHENIDYEIVRKIDESAAEELSVRAAEIK